MSENFADLLLDSLREKDSLLCLGMDPVLENFPPSLSELPLKKALSLFVMEILESVQDLVPVIKFQVACFERYGSTGFRVLEEALRRAKRRGIITILDGKRGDIGSTAEQYARAYLEEGAPLSADAITLNPYLGRDSLEPFFPFFFKGKGAFVLLRTSNPSAPEIQDLEVQGLPLYLKVAQLIREWGQQFRGKCGFSSLGGVVGATYPEELSLLRERFPEMLFLVPGYGAQGAGEKEVALAFTEKGEGAIVTSSRQIIYAFKRSPYREMEIEFGEAARRAYLDAREKLNSAVKERMKK